MSVFFFEAWLLSRVLPFHRRQLGMEAERARITAIDGLRGILALSVLFLHAVEFYTYMRTGMWISTDSNVYNQLGTLPVTMFFFITGYVFWSKLIARPHTRVWSFLYGRLGRLGGVYGVACLLCFLLAAVVSDFHVRVSASLLAAQVLGWLLFFGSGHDINGIYHSRIWLGPGWTLKLEWLFYFTVPFLGWFTRRWYRLAMIVGVAEVVGRIADQVHLHGPIHLLWEMMGSYAHFLASAFSIGMLVAACRLPVRLQLWARSWLASCLSLAFVAGAAVWARPEFGWHESLLLAVPFACIAHGNAWFGLLTSEPVRFLGRISYSFYLLHTILLTIEILFLCRYTRFAGVDPYRYWLFIALSGATTIVVSAYSYQFLEYPLLHLARPSQKRSRRVLAPAVADDMSARVEPAVM
jgi:peptidoglycan/LPS O-acetylase OafA/YrhL